MATFSSCDPCAQAAEVVRAQLGRIGIRVKIKKYEDAFGAASKPGTGIDIFDSGTQVDFPDSATFLSRALLQDTPRRWLSAEVLRDVEEVARLTGERRQSAAATLSDRLAIGLVPVVAYGNWVQGELFAPSAGCRVFPPFGYGVDLAALCKD
jgi:hypothetical protein